MNVREIPLKLFEEFRRGDVIDLDRSPSLSPTGWSVIAPADNGIWLRLDNSGHDLGYGTNSFLHVCASREDACWYDMVKSIAHFNAGRHDIRGIGRELEEAVSFWLDNYGGRLWGDNGNWPEMPDYWPVLTAILTRARELYRDPSLVRRRYLPNDRPEVKPLPKPPVLTPAS